MIRYLFVLFIIASTASAQTRIIDGDTIELNGEIIRINGIDAPEHGQRCGEWACGAAATDALAALVEDRIVTCDALGSDGYGRTIARCFAGQVDIGQRMVDQGHAWAFLKYSDSYEATQAKAKSLGLGVWSGPYQAPWDYREEKWQSASQGPNGCRIKGNISANGRIYHTPWSPWYSRTRINLAKGERWFCDEAEAVNAGWRAPYWD